MSHTETGKLFVVEPAALDIVTVRFNSGCLQMDAEIINEIGPALVNKISCWSFQSLLIELGHIHFVTSAFLSLYAVHYRISKENRPLLSLRSMAPNCQRIVKLAGFESILKIYETAEQAHRSLQVAVSLSKAWANERLRC